MSAFMDFHSCFVVFFLAIVVVVAVVYVSVC